MEGRNNLYTMSGFFKESEAIIHEGCIEAAFYPQNIFIPCLIFISLETLYRFHHFL